jgi:hypothetical protein
MCVYLHRDTICGSTCICRLVTFALLVEISEIITRVETFQGKPISYRLRPLASSPS